LAEATCNVVRFVLTHLLSTSIVFLDSNAKLMKRLFLQGFYAFLMVFVCLGLPFVEPAIAGSKPVTITFDSAPSGPINAKGITENGFVFRSFGSDPSNRSDPSDNGLVPVNNRYLTISNGKLCVPSLTEMNKDLRARGELVAGDRFPKVNIRRQDGGSFKISSVRIWAERARSGIRAPYLHINEIPETLATTPPYFDLSFPCNQSQCPGTVGTLTCGIDGIVSRDACLDEPRTNSYIPMFIMERGGGDAYSIFQRFCIDSIQLEAISPNQAPEIDQNYQAALARRQFSETLPIDPIELTRLFTDPDGDRLTYEFTTQLPSGRRKAGLVIPGLEPSPDNFFIEGTPEKGGPYSLEITARDPGGAEVTATLQFQINQAPQVLPPYQGIVALPPAQKGVERVFVLANRAFFDGDRDVLTYDMGLEFPVWLTLDSTTGAVEGNPPPYLVGQTISFSVIADDNKGGTAEVFFKLPINPNQPPIANPSTITAPSATVRQNYRYTNIPDFFTDPDPGDQLEYSGASNKPDWLTVLPNGELIGVPQAGDVETRRFDIIATDPNSATATLSVTLTVQQANQPPEFVPSNFNLNHTAIEDIALEPSSSSSSRPKEIDVSNAFRDPEGGPLQYTVTGQGGTPLPTGLRFINNKVVGTPAKGTAKTYTLTLTATDAQGLQGKPRDFTLEIQANQSPEVVRGKFPNTVSLNQCLNGANSLDLNQAFVDPEGEAITVNPPLANSQLPPNLSYDPSNQVISGCFSASGTFSVNIQVQDASGQTERFRWNITVTP
jgi:hypothetical protein